MQSGSCYNNYKGVFSIVMLDVVESDYKFRNIDVESSVAGSDASIFNDTELNKRKLEDDTLGVPEPTHLAEGEYPSSMPPYRRLCFRSQEVDDEAFV